MRKTRQVCAGFTLVEILVVVIILGIASAVIVPQIGNSNDLKAAAAARFFRFCCRCLSGISSSGEVSSLSANFCSSVSTRMESR